MNLIASRNPIEEDAKVRKSGTVTAALTTPGKSRKSGKFFAVVLERALELYENEKSYRKKKTNNKTAKHLIDLATAFNVHKNYVDPKLKTCVCVMGPDETLLLKGDSAEQTEDWYDAILACVIPARALHLGRPIQHSEFFECAWDVELVQEPKFKGKRSPADTDDVDLCSTKVAKLEPGVRRLCYYPHTIIICKKRIEPATQNLPPAGIPPFSMDTFLEIPRMFIASFESQGAYFIIKMGRGSPTGAGNIFLLCESEEIAADAHLKLRAIIDRELEKKKKAHGGNIVTGLTPVRPHPRERSHTQQFAPRTNNNGHVETAALPKASASDSSRRKESEDGGVSNIFVPAPAHMSARDRRAMLRNCKALIDSFEEGSNRVYTTPGIAAAALRPRGSLGNPSAFPLELLGSRLDRQRSSVHSLTNVSAANALERRIGSPAQSTSMIGRKSSNCSTSSRCGSMSYGAASNSPMQMKSARDNGPPEGSFPWAPFSSRRLSNTSSIKEEDGYQPMVPTSSRSIKTTSYSTAEETEDSGGTLRLENGSYCDPHGSTRSSQRSLIVMAEIPIEANKMSRGSEVEDGELDGSSVGGVSGSEVSAASCGSGDMNAHDTYTVMEAVGWNCGSNPHLLVPPVSHDIEFHLEEVRSFISDSSDSCYSSMAAQSANGQFCMSQPRAYSFAGRPTKKPVTLQPRCATGTSATEAPIANAYSQYVDPRKRAFSLGSKNLLPPFRKNSATRQARQSQTSTSGVSISSAEYSMDPPSSSLSSNHLATTGENEEYRDRSGSFGSGRSTPYTTYSRRPGPLGLGDHLFEIDFSDLSKVDSSSILAKGGSGSIASIDSPSRSRTSSFDCNVRKEDMMIPMSSSFSNASTMDSVRKQLQSQMLNKRRSIDDGDYVITEPPKVDVQRAECLTPDSSLDQMKTLDLRKSQVIETIEENTSEKSSRSGSRISLAGLNDAGGKDDDYTVMECSSSNGHSSDASTKVKKEDPVQTRPDRSTSNPVKEELAVPPANIPKRSSVPSMSSSENCKDEANLNYACLKMHEDNGSPSAGVFLTAGPSRIRSKSGILFSEERSAPNALDYATFKPR